MRIELNTPDDKQKNNASDFNPPKTEKRTLKSEVAKMKELGFKKGFEYFWEYYRIPVIIIAIVIAVTVSLVTTIIKNSRPYIIQAYMYNNYLSENADIDALEAEFADHEGLSLRDYQITFDFSEYFDPSSSDETSYTTLMKIMAMISAKDIDCIGGNQEFMDYYAIANEDDCLFADLEKVLPAQFFQYLKDQDKIYYSYRLDADGNKTDKYAAGIDISNTRIVNENCMVISPCYMGMAVNTERQQSAIDFLEWIFDYQG